MLADPADQQRLLNLADMDAELARIRHAAQTLPQHAQINKLMQTRQDVTDDLVAATTRAGDLEVAVRRAEADLVPVRARLERESKRVNDGSVTDGKTLRGLMEEVERLGRRISDLEDEQLEVMGESEEAEALKETLTRRKAEVEDELRALVADRNEQVAALQAEAEQVQASRKRMEDQVAPDLVKLYDRIRAAKGVGAARLVRGRCGGCQLQIPVSDLDGYRKAPANQVLRCVECDRILVRTPESGL